MSRLIIEGGRRLCGTVTVQGAKNSALPLLAASLLGNTESVIHNCPALSDVDSAVRILRYLGCSVRQNGSTVTVNPQGMDKWEIPEHLMREMRSSIVFLGAIAAKMGRARISFPGGCELGPRPIDLHLSALRQLGLTIEEDHGFLDCRVDSRLKGAKITLSFPSVGATENIMLAAVTAEGETLIVNAAREPEISDLADFLNGCGARIHGAGEGTIRIEGVRTLGGTVHCVIPDRIVAATYMAAAAVTGGSLTLQDVIPAHLGPVVPLFEETGCDVALKGHTLRITAPPRLHSMKTVRTMPYPGFPTDAQALMMAVATLTDGNTLFVENIFESRYKHVGELMRMGASIKVEGRVAVVEGVPALSGAPVEATDLRGGAS
ncbi:MAG: UDP-N-acetylglucosamine 1-carboxyvinyltransferase, partial [Clostridiales bacterium]|nr:UDP-N-acetylglucosamine 1-carboxyvinyltransferase [Clostridiales bacterium]